MDTRPGTAKPPPRKRQQTSFNSAFAWLGRNDDNLRIDGDPGPFRLSSSMDELRFRYDVVVVGSGYGGAIMASRLARADKAVCVLERGRELWPGEYPSSLAGAWTQVQVRTADHRAGSRSALFDFRAAAGQSVLVGCGLGGTSLINANVSARAQPSVFDDRWPTAFRGNRGTLDPYYELAETWLGARPYPDDWPILPKRTALGLAATSLGTTLEAPPINVTFTRRPNLAGVEQHPCVLCGDCCSGCNVGAKNTVLMNYLPDAWRFGAQIFTEMEVQRVRRGGSEWLIDVVPLSEKRGIFGGPPLMIRAETVVLAAGTLGSTEILMRSEATGLKLSKVLGRRFNGNGDVLAFATDTRDPVDGVGWSRHPDGRIVGPTIAGKLTLGSPRPDPVSIEDGAIPGMLSGFVPIAVAAAALTRRPLTWPSLDKVVAQWKAAQRHTMTFLAMSMDDDDGQLRLHRTGVAVDWGAAGRQTVFGQVGSDLERATNAMHGTYVADPISLPAGDPNVITVHPLGGCIMADRAEEGVVNDQGGVFAGASGVATHPGLYVADGSIIPRPLDVNPLLTISALAERSVAELATVKNWDINWGLASEAKGRRHPVRLRPPTRSPATRLELSERLAGWFMPMDQLNDVETVMLAPAWSGRPEHSEQIEFVGTIIVEDLDALRRDPSTEEHLVGTVVAPALSPEPLMLTNGKYRLLQPVPSQVETWHMIYEMDLVAVDGNTFTLKGIKIIRDAAPWHTWTQTTTLYITLTDDGTLIGKGVMRISLTDFLRQMRTVRVSTDGGLLTRELQVLEFQRIFLSRLYHVFGGVAAELDRFVQPDPTPAPRPRTVELPEPSTQWCDSRGKWHGGDDVRVDGFLRLTRYYDAKKSTKGPVMLAAGFGMSARSFATTAVDVNLAEYLFDNGYDVWLFDYRASIDLWSCRTEFTIDDIATKDWPAAVKQVHDVTKSKVKVVGHCVGSASLLMALATGLTDVERAVCSQFTLHPMTSTLNRVKSALGIAKLARGLRVHGLAPDGRRSWPSVIEDIVLKVAPVPTNERCGQSVCRWINAIYGLTHYHAQLDDTAHRALYDLFGYANTTSLEHFATMMRHELAVNFKGQDVYTKNPERLRIPLHFLAGSHNYIFHPEGTRRTLGWLRANNDPDLYSVSYLENYGHLDCFIGRDAATDVFPRILEHL